ncbi:MAG: heparinase II/III family protein [Trueperaceae bacterium]
MSSIILSEAELARVRSQLERFEWYRGILEGYRSRIEELIARAPDIPVVKGRAFYESCPDDNARLSFDPYAPRDHICERCGRNWQGEVYDLAWVRQFQDWLGKRLVEAGILYRLEGDERFARLVRDSLDHFVRRYPDYPLANNLLGPTRLFQSTYLEAFWLVDVVAAYDLTRNSGAFGAADHAGVRDLFYESCSVIRSYDEGRSNRQAFNNAGMGAVALLYEDEDLVQYVLDVPHGFSFHMRESLLEDGIWYEGENYHFATLDHSLNLAELARHRGIDLYEGTSGYGSLRPMFDGPLKVMLPDLTFPSRKDSWFGRGVGYHKDIYELGFARYGDERFGGLLAHAYSHGTDRRELGWRSFLYLEPKLPQLDEEVAEELGPGEASGAEHGRLLSVSDLRATSCERMPGTGVAVLRRDSGGAYASLEYGHYGGGHGHPDRLHLTLFADGVQWLLDPGTGWYHVPELGWYRSTIAHNTISVDGRLQVPQEGELVAFGDAGDFQVAQARVKGLADGVTARRTLCLGDGFLTDVLDVSAEADHQFDLALHTPAAVSVGPPGAAAVASRGAQSRDGQTWAGSSREPAHTGSHTPGPAGSPQHDLGNRDGYEFLSRVEALPAGSVDLTASADGRTMRIVQLTAAATVTATDTSPSTSNIEVFTARAPGIPLREDSPLSSLVSRSRGRRVRFVTAYLWGARQQQASLGIEGDGVLLQDSPLQESSLQDSSLQGDGDRSYRFLIDDSDGVAVSASDAVGVERLAWFGRRNAELGGVTLRADRPLAAASFVRADGGATFEVSLPREFGALSISGLEASEIIGLPDGSDFQRDQQGMRFTQASGTASWLDSQETLTLFAGCTNTFTFNSRTYGGAAAEQEVEPKNAPKVEPAVDLPSAWKVTSLEEYEPGRWQMTIDLPAVPADISGTFVLDASAHRTSVPYRIVPPITTVWRIDSVDGVPCLTLEVSDKRGQGGAVGVEIEAPWLEPGVHTRRIELPPGGRAGIRLPLPLEGPGDVSARPVGIAADGGSRDGSSSANADDLTTAGETRLPHSAADGAWQLPGAVDLFGEYAVSAKLTLFDFVGITKSKLPLYWCLPTTAAEQNLLRLSDAKQALWSDRSWRDEADASAQASLTWCEEGLQLTCLVRDDVHVSDANKDDLYENDSLQIYFDFRKNHHGDRSFSAGVAAYILAPSADKRSLKVVPIAGNREISNRGARAAWFSADDVETSCEPTSDGYRVDVFFPYSSLAVAPLKRGDVIGFDLALSDNDGTWYRSTMLLWSGSRGRRCYIRGSYHDPQEFGWLIVSG